MWRISSLLLLATALNKWVNAQDNDGYQHGDEAVGTMGPVAFMWPPDREWGAAQDNTAPCGSAQGVTNRTEFPLLNGAVALVMQDEAWTVNLAISYKDDPTSNSDFETIISSRIITELDPGHECYTIPNPPADTEEGWNATLQLQYIADFSTNLNETYYACADITYVPVSKFKTQIPCFNVSSEDFDSEPVAVPTGGDASASTSATATSSGGAAGSTSTGASAASSNGTSKSSSGGGGLSGGTIAGIVVGCIAGVGLLIAGVWFIFKRREQRIRHRAAAAVRMNDLTAAGKNPAGSVTSGEA